MAQKKKTKKTSTTKKKKTAVKAAKTRKKTTKVQSMVVEDPLTEEEIDQFRQLLLEKRMELLGDVVHMREGALESNRQESAGELSSMPIHMADVGTDNYEQEFTLGLIESDRQMLKDIDRALAKIGKGAYGVCEGTSKQIPRARLTAKPEARYSIDFARKLEQGLVDLPNENNLIDSSDKE